MKRPLAMVLAAAATFFLVGVGHDPSIRPPYGLSLFVPFNTGDAIDYSPYHHTPTLNNGAVITAGNRFITLDGVNDYLSYPDSAALDMAGDFSLSCWVRRNGAPSASMIMMGKFNSTSNTGYIFYILPTTGTAGLDGGVGSGYRTGPRTISSVCDNNWRHVVATRSGSTWSIYLDGSLSGSSSVSALSMENERALGVGAYDAYGGWLNNLGGSLDDVRIYNARALTANEVAQLYSAGHP